MIVPRLDKLGPRWKLAAALLAALALAPFFIGGAVGTAAKVVLGVGAVGLVAALGVRGARGRAQAASAASLDVVSRSALGPRTFVAVVEFEGRRLLVSYGDSFAQVLAASSRRRSGRRGA